MLFKGGICLILFPIISMTTSKELKDQLEKDFGVGCVNFKKLIRPANDREIDYQFERRRGLQSLMSIDTIVTVAGPREFDHYVSFFDDPSIYSKKKERMDAAVAEIKALENIRSGNRYFNDRPPTPLSDEQKQELNNLTQEIVELVWEVRDENRAVIAKELDAEAKRYESNMAALVVNSADALDAVKDVAIDVIDRVTSAGVIIESVQVVNTFGVPLDDSGQPVEHLIGQSSKIPGWELSSADVKTAKALTTPTVFINCLSNPSDRWHIRVIGFDEYLHKGYNVPLRVSILSRSGKGFGFSLETSPGNKVVSDCKQSDKFDRFLFGTQPAQTPIGVVAAPEADNAVTMGIG